MNNISHYPSLSHLEIEQAIGRPKSAPPLPANLQEILLSPCPWQPQKRIIDTHIVVLFADSILADRLIPSLQGIYLQVTIALLQEARRYLSNDSSANLRITSYNTSRANSVISIDGRINEDRIQRNFWALVPKVAIKNKPNSDDEFLREGYRRMTAIEGIWLEFLHQETKQKPFFTTPPYSTGYKPPHVFQATHVNSCSQAYYSVNFDGKKSSNYLTFDIKHNYSSAACLKELPAFQPQELQNRVTISHSEINMKNRSNVDLCEKDWAPLGVTISTNSSSIEELYNQPCPLYQGKTIGETHFLFCIPAGIDIKKAANLFNISGLKSEELNQLEQHEASQNDLFFLITKLKFQREQLEKCAYVSPSLLELIVVDSLYHRRFPKEQSFAGEGEQTILLRDQVIKNGQSLYVKICDDDAYRYRIDFKQFNKQEEIFGIKLLGQQF